MAEKYLDSVTTNTHTLPMSEQSSLDQSELRRRSNKTAVVKKSQFAGRLGGNQEFIVIDQDSHDAQSLLKKQPDAAPLSTLSASFDLRGFLDSDLWRMAIIEGWGTFLMTSLLGAVSSGLTIVDQSVFATTIYGAFTNFLGLALFTYCLAPITGGHLNPSISMGTFVAGLSTFPRTVLYIIAQCIGATVAGFWLRLGLGDAYFPHDVIPGCTVDPKLVSPGQMLVLEYTFAQALIFIAFGIGLDPRQGRAIGPAYAPLLIGFELGIGTLCSSFVKPGYTGVSFNPARCLGLMAAKNDFGYHYVHWLGPLAACVLNGIFYQLCPPWTREKPLFTGTFRRLRKHL